MKFSVIIPVYNTEKFLPECLDSVINQNYSDLEIIIVNDGSPDNSDEICRSYAARDRRIKYIVQANQGVAIARNNGIAAATGDYIYCIDSDDSIAQDFFYELNRTVTADPADIVIFDRDNSLPPVEYLAHLPTFSFAVKKSFLDEHPDIRFPEYIQPSEDNLFFYMLSSLTKSIARCRRAEHFYRSNPDSVTHTLSDERHLRSCRQSFETLDHFHRCRRELNNKLHLTCFMRCIYATFTDVSTSEAKNEILKQMQDFIKDHPLEKLKEDDKRWFPQNFDIFIKSRTYREYKLRNKLLILLRKFFSIDNISLPDKKRIIIHIFGIKFSFKKRYQ